MARPGLIYGATRIGAALRLLRRERSLWAWCVLPFALNVVLFGGAIAVFAAYYGPIAEWLQSLLAVGDPGTWFEWLWVGPIRALAWLIRWILVVVLLLAIYFLFAVVGSIIASPFLDVLSEKVERLQTGSAGVGAPGWRAALRAAAGIALEDAKRTFFFLGGQLAILALGLLPGVQPLAALAALVFAALFLSLDYTAYVLDRHQVSFRTRRRWMWQHRRSMLGFGAASLGCFLVPGLNFLCLPVLVTAGTMLALDAGLPEPPQAV